MVNDTQTVFQNFPVKPLEGVIEKINIDELVVYVKEQTSGIHRNKVGGKLVYMSILVQPRLYTTQSGSTASPVPTNPCANMTYPSGNLTAAIISATTRAYEEKIRTWKEYDNVMRAAKQVIFYHVLDT